MTVTPLGSGMAHALATARDLSSLVHLSGEHSRLTLPQEDMPP